MAAYNKFYDFTEQLTLGVHDFDTDVFKIYLSNATPSASADAVKGDLAEISAGNGYTAGGTATTITVAEVTGVTTVSGTQVVFTASGGSIGPFQYAVLYNSSKTITAGAGPLVAWWDYGSALTLNDGETFTVKFSNASPGAIFTLT
jgi:hypothetical protein